MKRKSSEYCESRIGKHCRCSVKAGLDHDVYRCACGGEWGSGAVAGYIRAVTTRPGWGD